MDQLTTPISCHPCLDTWLGTMQTLLQNQHRQTRLTELTLLTRGPPLSPEQMSLPLLPAQMNMSSGISSSLLWGKIRYGLHYPSSLNIFSHFLFVIRGTSTFINIRSAFMAASLQ